MNGPPALSPGGRVFLTGGTGLVGSHVAAVLRAEGYRVRALHRSGSEVGQLEGWGCELVEGDLADGVDSLGSAMVGCHALVHAAAVVYAKLPWAEVHEVNVGGTRRIFGGAVLAGIRRAVHLSSVAVYGDLRGPIDEDTRLPPTVRPREHYARSKREAETVVEALGMDGSMSVVVLRASSVYGEGDRLFIPGLTRFVRLPLHFLAGSGRTPIPAVYAGNLAHAVLAGLRASLPAGARRYNVASDHPLTQRRLLSAVADGLGVPFRPLPLPKGLVLAAARVAEGLGVRVTGAEELPLGRAAALAVHPNPFLSQRIRDELGWAPPIGRDEALERTVGWLRGRMPEDGRARPRAWFSTVRRRLR